MTKEAAPLTEAQIQVLYTRGLIDRATWNNALRSFRGDHGHVGQHAIQTCAVAIEALVERAVDAACAMIQDKLGVKTGDLAATVLSDGSIERELTRYVHAELAATVAGGVSDVDATPVERGDSSGGVQGASGGVQGDSSGGVQGDGP